MYLNKPAAFSMYKGFLKACTNDFLYMTSRRYIGNRWQVEILQLNDLKKKKRKDKISILLNLIGHWYFYTFAALMPSLPPSQILHSFFLILPPCKCAYVVRGCSRSKL